MYRLIEEEIEPTVGLPSPKTFHRVLSPSTDTGHPFYCYFEKPPYLFVFNDTLEIRRTYSHLKPPGSPRGDYFIFHITNFPFLNTNIPPSTGYGVFISQFIWYARACSSNMFDCFTLRPCHFSIMFSQGYLMKHLESSFGKFNCRYGDLIQQHLVSLTRMLDDNLVHDHIQCHPPSFMHYINNLRTCYWPWPCYRIWLFCWSSRAFHI